MSPRRRAERAAWEADQLLLAGRLRRLGLPEATHVRVHANRTVMVSVNGRGGIGIHRGYAYAPDRVLEAIVTFVSPRTRHGERNAARRALVAFPVEHYVPSGPARRCRTSGSDDGYLRRLRAAHADLNAQHFDGGLATIPLRVSPRMTTCLGAVSVDRATGRAREIVLSRRHLERDPWSSVCETLLHEMVHQWQVEQGYPPDHGRKFKAKASAVGITPAARSTTKVAPRTAPPFGRM